MKREAVSSRVIVYFHLMYVLSYYTRDCIKLKYFHLIENCVVLIIKSPGWGNLLSNFLYVTYCPTWIELMTIHNYKILLKN